MNNGNKSLAFLPFTKVAYQMHEPGFGVVILFDKSNAIKVNGISVSKENLQNYLTSLPSDKPNKYQFCFDKNLSFGDYIAYKVMLHDLKFPIPDLNFSNQEFIY
jgi:biopolymer transport protein ExbD